MQKKRNANPFEWNGEIRSSSCHNFNVVSGWFTECEQTMRCCLLQFESQIKIEQKLVESILQPLIEMFFLKAKRMANIEINICVSLVGWTMSTMANNNRLPL